VRRILYEHLSIPCGLECEVVERVNEAAERMPTPELAPAVTSPAGVQAP